MRLLLQAALFLGMGLIPIAQSQAGFIFEAQQVGSDIVVTVTGSIDLTGAFNAGSGSSLNASTGTSFAYVGSGSYDVRLLNFTSGPTTVTATSIPTATSTTGGFAGFNLLSGTALTVYVPQGYTSGSPITASATFANKTYADFGWYAATPKVWTLSNGDTITAVPEPTTGSVLLSGVAGIVAFARRRRS